jgi:ATP-dependent Clp protease ATP-binding subunit ClpX
LRQVHSDDLLQYGMIPEFVGRLPVVVSVEPARRGGVGQHPDTSPRTPWCASTKSSLRWITWSSSSTNEALRVAAQEAISYRMGARGLRTIIEETLLDIMYELPSHPEIRKYTVTADDVRNRRDRDRKLFDAAA